MTGDKKRGRKPSTITAPNDAEEPMEESAPLQCSSSKRPKSLERKEGDAGATSMETSRQPVIVFAHGAGANSNDEWMVRWKRLLAETTDAVEVITFDYPYLAEGKKKASPPKPEKLVDPHAAQVANATRKYPGHPVVLVGKSLGSRVGCLVAGQEGSNVAAVVCLGHPLQAMDGTVREESLLALRAPVLFVQGTKDPQCPLKELAQVRKKLSVQNELYTVEGGDHSFKVAAAALKKSSLTHAQVEQKAADAIQSFLKEILSP